MKRIVPLVAMLIAFVAVHGPLHAQGGAQGTILGTVTDSSGALIPGGVVTITNLETNFSSTTKSNPEGAYSVPYLRPGRYKVQGEKEGFSKSSVDKLTLQVGQSLRVDLALRPGELSESVSVTANALQLDTENAAVGTVVNERQVVDLPLNGRQFNQLMFLDATATSTFTETSTETNGGGSISVAGARASSNMYLLDGQSINVVNYQSLGVLPSVDLIQEFNLQQHGYSAEYGGASTQVNVSTKSGTNEFHGTAFEFLRNDALDARNFFDGAAISPLRQNQFGYVLGGPVLIPKLYNGKNKTFFLTNYEGMRVRSSGLGYFTVPTQAQLSGVFTTPVSDPLTGNPYSNGTIPGSLRSRVGTEFAKEVGTVIPNSNSGLGNYITSLSSPITSDQQTYRLDQYFGANNQFFGRYTFTEYNTSGYAYSDAASYTGTDLPNKALSLGFTHTFSPSVVNQLRFGWFDHALTSFGKPASQASLDALGLKNNFKNVPGTAYPLIGLIGYGTFGGAQFTPGVTSQTTLEFSDSLSINKGRHTLTTGVNYRHYSNYDSANGDYYGDWIYSGAFSGNATADMLLGYVGTLNLPNMPSSLSKSPANLSTNQFYLAPFVQDDWKVSPRLTVNAGVRYDFTSMPSEINGLNAWWDYSNKAGGLCISNKSVIDQGLGGDVYRYCGATAGSAPRHVFAPRAGFAYRPFNDNKTVIRSGYGIFYDSTERAERPGAYAYYPYGLSLTLVGIPGSNYILSDNQFPVVSPGPAVRSQVLSFVFAGPSKTLPPYSQQWTFSIQRELSKSTTLDATYIGSKGTHLLSRMNINQPYPYDPAHPSSADARRPYADVGSVLSAQFDINSSYNALSVKLQHHSGDLNLMLNYAWSKSIDDKSSPAMSGSDQGWAGVTNTYNVGYDRSVSSFDTPHRLVAAFVYDLPFGGGKRFLAHLNKAGNLVLGGWQLNGIVNFQSGQPYSIYGYDYNGLLGLASPSMNRADLVGNPNSGFHKSITEWFNTGAFANASDGLFGTSGRNILRSPGSANWDMSLFKNIPLHGERTHLQLRGEFFNAFNHTQFGGPDPYMTDQNYGKITGANSGRIIQVAAKMIF
jgi:hypothetical protein